MELRPELCPPVVSPERIAELCAAIEAVATLLECGEPAEAEIGRFNADTGHDYTAEDFLTYWESRNVEDFALEAARPARPKVADVTRDELIEIVRRIQAVDDDLDYYLVLLTTNVAHPRVAELIFGSSPDLTDESPAAIVDAALAYRPLAL